MAVDVTVDTRRIQQLAGLVKNAVDASTKTIAHTLQQEVTQKTPKKTGKLQRGWTIRSIGNTFAVENAVNYARFVISGTKPHDIKPTRRHVLAFNCRGGKVFAKRVHHPGTKPNNFTAKATDSALGKFAGVISKALRDQGVI